MELLRDGDEERFGGTRAQVTVYAAPEDGTVELHFDRPFIIDEAGLVDLAYWLQFIVAPSLHNIYESVFGEEEEEDEWEDPDVGNSF